jgi:4-amino-4-deoxy-L-arabinose transferase-like glycosyltransferase
VAAVYLTFRIGELLFGRVVGLCGAWLFGLFYVPVFFSMRIMHDVPHLTLVLLGVYLILQRRRSSTALGAAFLTLAVFMRYPVALMFVVVGAHIIDTEGWSASRNRDYWIAALVAGLIALPFLVHAQVVHGDVLFGWKASRNEMPAMGLSERLDGLRVYFRWAVASLGSVLFLMLAGGMVLMMARAALPHRWRQAPSGSERLVLLWALLPLAYFSMAVKPGLDLDRYIIDALPPAFLSAGCLVVWIARRLFKDRPVIATVVTTVAMVSAGISMAARTDAVIRTNLGSQIEMRDAGEWLAVHLSPGEIVLSRSIPQLTFYTTHSNDFLPEERSVFEAMRASGHVDFVVVSVFEKQPQWVLQTPPATLGLKVAARFPDGPLPSVVIFAAPAASSRL